MQTVRKEQTMITVSTTLSHERKQGFQNIKYINIWSWRRKKNEVEEGPLGTDPHTTEYHLATKKLWIFTIVFENYWNINVCIFLVRMKIYYLMIHNLSPALFVKIWCLSFLTEFLSVLKCPESFLAIWEFGKQYVYIIWGA